MKGGLYKGRKEGRKEGLYEGRKKGRVNMKKGRKEGLYGGGRTIGRKGGRTDYMKE
jgi:hypothetical protein